MTAKDILGDAEAAKLFGISEDTLKHKCMANYVCKPGKIDVRKACPVIVGKKRRWYSPYIIEVLNGAGLCNGSTRAFEARRTGSIPVPATTGEVMN